MNNLGLGRIGVYLIAFIGYFLVIYFPFSYDNHFRIVCTKDEPIIVYNIYILATAVFDYKLPLVDIVELDLVFAVVRTLFRLYAIKVPNKFQCFLLV